MLPRHASRVTCCHVSRVVTCPHPEPVLTDHLPILILLKNKEISRSKSSSLHCSVRAATGVGSAAAAWPGLPADCDCVPGAAVLDTADLESAAWCRASVQRVHRTILRYLAADTHPTSHLRMSGLWTDNITDRRGPHLRSPSFGQMSGALNDRKIYYLCTLHKELLQLQTDEA